VKNQIKGWMSDKELEWLQARAAEAESVVELGCFMGRTTFALLSGCRGTVTAVDTFEGVKGHCDNPEVLYATFMKNCGHFPNLRVIKGDSAETAAMFESVDMVMVDAQHVYPLIKKDLEAWLPKVKKLICGHDFDDGWPGVIQAVDELMPNREVYMDLWYWSPNWSQK